MDFEHPHDHYKERNGDHVHNGNPFVTMPDGNTGIAVFEKPPTVLSYNLKNVSGAVMDGWRDSMAT